MLNCQIKDVSFKRRQSRKLGSRRKLEECCTVQSACRKGVALSAGLREEGLMRDYG